MEKFGSGIRDKPGFATLVEIRIIVADPNPASGAFLAPGSGMEKIRFQDRAQTSRIIFLELTNNFLG